MDLSLLIGIAAFLLLAGIGLIYVTLRGNKPFWPQDAFQWAAVGLSSVLVVVAGLLVVLLLTYPAGLDSPLAGIADGGLNEPAPNFNFRLVQDDTEMDLEGLKGNVVLLNFWATWCGPCLMELPELNRLQEAYRDRGLVVLTISDEPRTDLLAFQQTVELRTVSGYLPDPSVLGDPFNRIGQVRPVTYIIDRDGILRSSMVGAGNFDLFADAVSPYLGRDMAEQ